MKKILLAPIIFVRFLYQSISLALSQIWANKTRSFLTTLGIIIGVASVTSVVAALSGMKSKVMDNFETFGTNKIYIWPEWPRTGPLKHASWRQIRFRPQQFEGLLDHCPSVEHIALTSSAGTHTGRHSENSIDGVRLQGIQASFLKIENRPVIKGRPFSVIDESQARRVCLISSHLRDKLRMDIECTGQTIIIGRYSFRVIGVLEPKPELIFDQNVNQLEAFIPFTTAQNIMDSWIRAVAAARSPDVAEEAKSEISFFLRRTRHIKPGDPDTFNVEVIASFIKQFENTASMITLVAGAVVSVSLLVGGVGIMNIMLVSVSERTREIGLRKAVGAKSSAILTQFLVEAIVLCFIGGGIGLGLGNVITSLISKSVPMLDKTQIPLWAVLLSFGFAGTVGVFFGMFPAVKAAKLDPIEALRHE